MMHLLLGRRRMLAAASGAISLGGCSLLFPESPPRLYKLAGGTGDAPEGPPIRKQLVVTTPVAPESLDTDRIALTVNDTKFDYFADSAWTDRAPLLLQGLLLESFENSGTLSAVGRESSNLTADYVLETELRNFEARYNTAGDQLPTAVVRLVAQLVEMPDRKAVGAVRASGEAAGARNRLGDIVEAFDKAVGEVVARIVAWTLQIMESRQ